MAQSVIFPPATNNQYLDSLVGVHYTTTDITYYIRNTNAEHYESWNNEQINALNSMLSQYAAISELSFQRVYSGSINDANMDFAIVDPAEDDTFTWGGIAGYAYYPMSPRYYEQENDVRFSDKYTGHFNKGSFNYFLLLHETGHALGLAHPHDTGAASLIFPGVDDPYEGGYLGLNDARYTVMSYNTGHLKVHPITPMAFDVAAIQYMYGETAHNIGNNIYDLNLPIQSYYITIWDSAGIDQIKYDSNADIIIDLRAATLQDNDPHAGGYFSGLLHDQLNGGFYIAHGVIIENAFGGLGNDLLNGNYFDNYINGGGGNDRISGKYGNDELFGFWGDDILAGNEGNDTLIGWDGNDILWGNNGIDYLYGSDGFDMLYGEVGDDILNGGGHNDKLYGGYGNDELFGHWGNDTLAGNEGNDTLTGWDGDDILWGNNGSDELWGNNGADTLYGEIGNDYLNGGGHDDELNGGAGDDYLFGYWGDDDLNGDAGDDELYGWDGRDFLMGDNGNDKLYGGNGDDSLWDDSSYGEENLFVGGKGHDSIHLSRGTDTVVYYKGDGNDYISNMRNGGGDTLKLGAGITIDDLSHANTGYDGRNETLYIAGSGQITFEDFNYGTGRRMDYIEFNDGTIIDMDAYFDYNQVLLL
ncbi:MAG: matrixin family metalloprotease [Alphaproteobacteria bacterium]